VEEKAVLKSIIKLVVIDKIVDEPFNAKTLSRHMPLFREERIAGYLRRNASPSPLSRIAIFTRYYKQWFSINRRNVERIINPEIKG